MCVCIIFATFITVGEFVQLFRFHCCLDFPVPFKRPARAAVNVRLPAFSIVSELKLIDAWL